MEPITKDNAVVGLRVAFVSRVGRRPHPEIIGDCRISSVESVFFRTNPPSAGTSKMARPIRFGRDDYAIPSPAEWAEYDAKLAVRRDGVAARQNAIADFNATPHGAAWKFLCDTFGCVGDGDVAACAKFDPAALIEAARLLQQPKP